MADELMERLGYVFGKPALLDQALTHRSHENEIMRTEPVRVDKNNERLEFLGDAVVDLVVGHLLMTRLPEAREGELSRLRASIVSEAGLSGVARRLNIGPLLKLGRGEDRSGGRQKTSLLADAFEAICGAVYLDGGFDAADRVVRNLLTPVAEKAIENGFLGDYKTRLQELTQSRHRAVPEYEVVSQTGPDHAKEFEVAVRLLGRVVGSASGPSKKQAEQRAARHAIASLDVHDDW